MRLTKAAEYAVRCILYMAGHPEFAIVSRKEISRNMEIPDQFLGKIAQRNADALDTQGVRLFIARRIGNSQISDFDALFRQGNVHRPD